MKLLLDTHLLLWWVADDAALPAAARALISDPENTIFVSAVSLWEIWLKESLGKLRLPPNFEDIVERQFFEALPLTAAHAREVSRLPWHHRDPFDRMLVAQSRVEGLTLLTADERVAGYGESVKLA